MGRVYLVRHLKLETERALKTIVPEISSNPQWRQRFSREAKAMARLSHPHIVAVHDADVLPDGDAFIEMEFVRGQSLDKRLQGNTPMPLAWVDRLLGQLCDALQVAHDMEIVHRDLKPQNLMIVDGPAPGQETVKILDFGIAKILNSSDPDDNVTQLGQSLGTPNYMSPEQISGDIEAVKACSDIYSVGVILYQLLTGVSPLFRSERTRCLLATSAFPHPRSRKRIRTSMSRRKSRPWSCAASRRTRKSVPHRPGLWPRNSTGSSPPRRSRLTQSRPIGFAATEPGWPWWEWSDWGLGVLLLPRIRPASPTEFSVTADPSSMELIAGGEAQPVRLQFVGLQTRYERGGLLSRPACGCRDEASRHLLR